MKFNRIFLLLILLAMFNWNNDISKDEAINSSLTGPFYLKYEYNLDYDLTLGISGSYERNKADNFDDPYSTYYYSGLASYSSYSILLRMNYLIMPDKKVQPYLGVSLGVRSGEKKYLFQTLDYNGNIINTESVSRKNSIGADLTFGMNYLIKKGFGVYGEVGIAKSVFQIGIVKCFGKNIP